MTREEAKEWLKTIKKGNYLGGIIDIPSDESTAFDMAIKALEQTIDREKTIEELEESLQKANATNTKLILLVEGKQKPIVSERKKGKWVANPNKRKGAEIECNKCGVSALSKIGIQVCSEFCPHCGSRMEREDDN